MILCCLYAHKNHPNHGCECPWLCYSDSIQLQIVIIVAAKIQKQHLITSYNIWILYNMVLPCSTHFFCSPQHGPNRNIPCSRVPPQGLCQGLCGISGEVLKVASELSHERIEEMIQESVAQLEQWAQLVILL